MAGIQGIIGIKGIQSIRDPILRKYDMFSTGIKGIIGIQGIQSPLSDQCCPSTTDWYTGIKVYWVYKGYKGYKVYWVYKG